MIVHKKEIAISALLIAFFVLFGYYCPFNWITGIPCPGCNMTTSFFFLLEGDFADSFYYHALCIPTILCFLAFCYLKIQKKEKLANRIILVWAICMILYYLFRMFTIFPNMPMEPNKDALLQRIFFG